MINDRARPWRLKGATRAGDEAYRVLAETAADAIVMVDEGDTILFVNPRAGEVFGYNPNEMVGRSLETLLPDYLSSLRRAAVGRHAKAGLRGVPWSGIELTGLHRSGRGIPLEVSFSEFTHEGRRYLTGIVRNISARKRAERRLAAQYAVTRILAESGSLRQAAPQILQTLCEHLRWDLGALWRVEREAGVLRAVEIWHAPGLGVEGFVNLSREVCLAPSVGSPGRVWQSGAPVWLDDVLADGNFPRAGEAAKAGLRSAFAFPVALAGEVLGVVELFSREAREPDAELQAMLASVGSQTGQFVGRKSAQDALRKANEELERRVSERTAELVETNARLKREAAEHKQSEKALRASEERFRLFSEASSEGIVVHARGVVLEANTAAAVLCGYDPAEVAGMPIMAFAAPEYHEMLLKNISAGVETTCEFDAVRKDGSTFPVELTGKNCEYKGQRARMILFHDITERRRAEASLRQSARDYRVLFEQAHDAICVFTPEDEIVLDVNRRACEMYGFSPSEFIGMSLASISRDIEGGKARVAQTLEKGDYLNFETVQYRKDGTEMFLEVNASVIDYRGARAILSINRDITERRRAEEELRRSEERFAKAFHSNPDPSSITRQSDSVILEINGRWESVFGYTREEVIGRTAAELGLYVNDEDRLRLKALFYEQGFLRQQEAVCRGKYGEACHVSMSAEPIVINDDPCIIFLMRDITERKRAEEALRRAEEKYRSIFENAVEGIFQSTPDGQFIEVNPAMARMYGYASPAEMIAARTDIALQHYVDPHRRDEFRRLVEERGVVRGFESEVYRKDGSRFWTSESVRAVRDPDGRVIYYEGTIEDITARKRAEEEVRASREELSLVMCNVDEIVYRGHFPDGPPDYRMSLVSPQIESLLGYRAEEVVSGPSAWLDNVHPDDRAHSAEHLGRVAQGKPAVWVYRFKHKLTGEYRWLEDRIIPELNERGAVIGFFGAARDVTEHKRAEEERSQLLRRLVDAQEEERRRIALELHDRMGQFSTALMLGLKSLKNSGGLPSESGGSIERLMHLTDQFGQEMHRLAWELRPGPLNGHGLRAALASYVEEWSARSGVAVDFHTEWPEGLRLPAQVETVAYRIVQEALTNVARHAGARRVGVVMERRRGCVRIVVEDDGRGFDVGEVSKAPETRRRMGLVGMHERAWMVGGEVEIESSPGVGTTIFLHIPVAGMKESGHADV